VYLISPEKPQYRANLHCHSTHSDGALTPERLKEIYKENGYQILAITDHEMPGDHTALSDPDFLMLTGYENYIRVNPNAKYNAYAPEVHLNLFARDPHNVKLICYNPNYSHYLPVEQHDRFVRAGSERTREYSAEYINDYICTAKEHGYLVAYNHAYWSMESEASYLAYEGCFSMEMVNYSSYIGNRLEHNGAVYDRMLCAGKRIFCHGADDNHNKAPLDSRRSDSFGGFTMILADELEYHAVIRAMEQGEMYSSMGPRFHEISFDGENIHVECSEADSIHVYFGSKAPKALYAEEDGVITSGDFRIDPNCRYVRVSVVDKKGRFADTRAWFRDELGLE